MTRPVVIRVRNAECGVRSSWGVLRIPHSAFASDLPIGKEHAVGGGLLGVAVLGHPQVGPADAVAAGDEAAERLGVARLAAHADAADAGAGRRRLPRPD